jgi:putative membrane-bound dehydrogenase-like protein
MSNYFPSRWAVQLATALRFAVFLLILLFFVYSLPDLASGVELKPSSQKGRFDDVNFQDIPNTEQAKTPFMSPAEALAGVKMPDGFHASMFAAEPMVRQPIAFTTDARGRLWVAENYTYAEQAVGFDNSLHDRIVILEDTDQDGHADHRHVFWDKASKLTSIEIGHGGVWALCPPHLLFLPDVDEDDQLDGEPIVMLDGWNADQVRHNVVNGLRWGPDGWLYGRHGILRTSLVGTPETPLDQRTRINCGIWRFHPVRQEFEVVAHGTTNSWGMDWDQHGQMFFINTVIGHLWHVIPGAHFERMYGDDFNPHLYQLIPQTADHFHWNTKEEWSEIRTLGVTPTTDEAGGGHAHSGLMIYQGDNWPDKYRGNVFTVNFHGRRLNRDTLQRRGASYVASHATDLVHFQDLWFRGLDLLTGPDGGVYVSDWSDAGECHDNDGIHRDSGRIYKITYGDGSQPEFADLTTLSDDLTTLSDGQLVELQKHKNAWYPRQARTILQGRALAGHNMDLAKTATLKLYSSTVDATIRLRALWCMHAMGETSVKWLTQQLQQDDEHLRVWAIKLLSDAEQLCGKESRSAILSAAENDRSGLVLLYLASGLQQLPLTDRWSLAERLARREEFSDDPVYPKILWYGIEPAVPAMPEKAIALVRSTRISLIRRHLVRRLAANIQIHSQPLAELAGDLIHATDTTWQLDVLEGMAAALQGWRKAEAPTGWKVALQELASSDNRQIQQRARELLVVFGDGRALEELTQLAIAEHGPVHQRRSAIRSLVMSRAEGLAPVLQQLLEDRDVAAEAIRGLAAFADPKTPELIIRYYNRLDADAQSGAINTLASRPVSASALLFAVAKGKIERQDVPAYLIRQMWSFEDGQIRDQLQTLWPEFRHTSEEKTQKIVEYQQQLTNQQILSANQSLGRVLFERSCATCHRLFGHGGTIGPDLTGAQRQNLTFLLQNIVDPSLQVADNYRMSIVVLADGRIINGVVSTREEPVIQVQTPTEQLAIPRDEVEEIVDSQLSMMPERLLDGLSSQQTRNLIAYLMSPQQVPLPEQASQ